MQPMNRRGVIAGAGGAALSLSVASCGRPTTQRRLNSADVNPQDYPKVVAVRHMADMLAEQTDGRLSIRQYPGGQLGSERDTLEITIFGGLDLNRVNLTALNPIARETFVPGLPFVFRSITHMRTAMDGAPGQQILRALQRHGLVGLCFYDSGARSMYNTRGPIRTPDDMAGMKIRVQNSELYVAMIEALGANATPMAFGEVYQALVQGVIDGAENNWPSYESTGHYQAARYYSRTEHVMAPEALVMSLKTWRTLDEADRERILAAARASVPVMRAAWDARVATSRDTVLASGVEVIEDIDKAPFQQTMARVYERFLDDPLLNLLADIQTLEDGADA